MEGRMDLRTSSKFRQTTTGAQLRRRREAGGALDDRYNTKTFSRQLNHYQTQVTKIYSLLPDYGLVCVVRWTQSSDGGLSLCKITIIMIIRYHLAQLTKPVSLQVAGMPVDGKVLQTLLYVAPCCASLNL